MIDCHHKTFADFTTGRGSDGRLLWKCSDCGKVAHWGEEWRYFGNIECLKCGTASIQSVHCEDCAKKLPTEDAAAANAGESVRKAAAVAAARRKVERAREKLDDAVRELALRETEA